MLKKEESNIMKIIKSTLAILMALLMCMPANFAAFAEGEHTHTYNVAWEWAADLSSAKATITCEDVTCELSEEITDSEIDITDTAVEGEKQYKASVAYGEQTFDSTKIIKNYKAAKCDEKGSYTEVVYPENEGTPTETEFEIAALGHDLGEWTETAAAVAPTCTEAGKTAVETSACSRCDYKETRGGEDVEATGHSYGEWEVTKEPTCTAQGIKARSCQNEGCSYFETDFVDALGHTEIIDVAVATTCTETGLTEGKHCSRCNETLVEQKSVDALGHNYEATVTTAATCENDGVRTFTCSRCKDSYNEAIPAIGHDYTITVDWDSLNNQTGAVYVSYVCKNNSSHNKNEKTTASKTVVQQQTEEQPEITRFTVTIGEFTASKEVQTKAEAAHVHTAGTAVEENRVEPTCAVEGSYDLVVYCSKCHEELSRDTKSIAKLTTHTPADAVEENRVEPTCKDFGSYDTVVYCSVCDTELSRETTTIQIVAHTYVPTVTAPTCTTGGYTIFKCSVCDFSYKGDLTNALGHSEYVELAVPATCTTNGKTERKFCTRCNVVTAESTVIPATGHSYKAVSVDWTSLNTSDASVYVSYVCKNNSSHTKNEKTTASASVIQQQTEEQPEITRFTVTIGEFTASKDVQTKAEAAHEHSPNSAVRENIVLVTCTTDGSYDEVVYCATCGEELSREHFTVPAQGHNWGEWTETEAAVAATCTTAGKTAVESRVCANDASHIEKRGGEAITALGHIEVIDEAVAVTCTTDGKTEGKHCSRCNAVLAPQETIDALGHDLSDWAVTTEAVAATCTESGKTAVETRACSRCDYSENRGGATISPTGHKVVTDPAVEETCTEKGKTEGKHCSVCGEVLVAQRDIEAKGHLWGAWSTTTREKAPTCTEAGATKIEEKKCLRIKCDATETRGGDAIPALGHDYKATVKAPTCTEQGYTTYTCSRCKNIYKDNYVDALGHTEVIDAAVAATCTEGGKTEGKHCSVCNTILVAQQDTQPNGHSWSETSDKCSVCSVPDEIKTGDDGKPLITDVECSNYVYFVGEEWNADVTFNAEFEKHNAKITLAADKVEKLEGFSTAEYNININPTFEYQGKTVQLPKVVCYPAEFYLVDNASNVLIANEFANTESHEDAITVHGSDITNNSAEYEYQALFRIDFNAADSITLSNNAKDKFDVKLEPKSGKRNWVSGKLTITPKDGVKPCKDSEEYYFIIKGTINSGTANEKTYTQKIKFTYEHTVVTDKAVAATFKAAGKTDGKHCSVCGKVITAQKNVAKLVSPTISKLTAGKKAFTATWKKAPTVDGYQIQYATNAKFTKAKSVTIKKAATTKTTVKKLTAKKKYYVRVRAYKTINGKKVYSAWSKSKTVTTKK